VARVGGAHPDIEAAVMNVARRHVPVPEVLLMLDLETGTGTGTRSRRAMILEWVAGTPLSQVLAASEAGGEADMAALGAEVGRVFAGIGSVSFERPGFFGGPDLAVGDMPPWSEQLPAMAVNCMAKVPETRLDPGTRRMWIELCAAHASSLVQIDDQARLVHADANPKNVLVTRVAGGWRVDAVLDWEFSFSGCPYADYANMTRFGGDYPAGFVAGFRVGFGEDRVAGVGGSPAPADWAYLGRVMDMFALSDLVTRPAGHPVADQAAAEIRRWTEEGIPT